MLKVYLDHNIYQDLKKEENKRLLDKVIAAKQFILFCFSEAHLYDLNRDKTHEKFRDMELIGSIAENHCYVFTDRTEFFDKTPREYYDDFDWSTTSGFDGFDDPFWNWLMEFLKVLPLEFDKLLEGVELPGNMPESIKKLLLEPATFYDFFTAMLDLSSSLTTKQNEFKELIRYLHSNSLLGNIYEGMGINGYDGKTVTDVPTFRESYARRFIVEGQQKTRYSLFSDMYHGLEFLGLVKGKPKKQKMMSMINDGRHAFFGTVCDVIVSKDSDFLEKCRFMYRIEGMGTSVLNFAELETFLDKQEQFSKLTISSLFRELSEPVTEDRIIDTLKEGTEERVYANLKSPYYSYFNLLGLISDECGAYWSLCRKLINFNNVPFKLQIRYIISRLLLELGSDIHQKGEFTFTEKLSDKAEIRCWTIQNIVISLVLDEILYLNIYPLQYLETRWKKGEVLVA